MNCLQDMFDESIEKRLNARFQKLVKRGLFARDVVPVQLENEERKRLALLCVCGDEVFAVICVNTKKTSNFSLFELLGYNLQAPKGIVNKSSWVLLSGAYEGLKAPLVVAQDVTVKPASKSSRKSEENG